MRLGILTITIPLGIVIVCSIGVAGYQMKTVLVSCDIDTLRRRETERGDRCAGSPEASLQYLYPKTGYDLCVDSGEASPAVLAEEIDNCLV